MNVHTNLDLTRLSESSGAQQRKKTRISPRLSESSGAQQRKNVDYAPLVGIFRGSAEKKHELRPACRNLPGLSREKM